MMHWNVLMHVINSNNFLFQSCKPLQSFSFGYPIGESHSIDTLNIYCVKTKSCIGLTSIAYSLISTPVHQCTAIIDASIRAATQLGLDRLASAIWDEEYLKRGLMKQKNSNNMIWSAQLLAKGDTSTRELGRAVWYAFVYLGSPHADYGDLSTKLPRVGAVDSDGYNVRCKMLSF